MYMGQFDDPNVIHLEGVVVKGIHTFFIRIPNFLP